jgi:hypothetical protein
MISSKYRFLYVHIPKTGGNSIQHVLLPISDDQKELKKHQDGLDRFEVIGPKTKKKHASLKAIERQGPTWMH